MPVVMDADRIDRSLTRIAHEIVERNRGVEDLALIAETLVGWDAEDPDTRLRASIPFRETAAQEPPLPPGKLALQPLFPLQQPDDDACQRAGQRSATESQQALQHRIAGRGGKAHFESLS